MKPKRFSYDLYVKKNVQSSFLEAELSLYSIKSFLISKLEMKHHFDSVK